MKRELIEMRDRTYVGIFWLHVKRNEKQQRYDFEKMFTIEVCDTLQRYIRYNGKREGLTSGRKSG